MNRRYVCHSNADDLKRLPWPEEFVFPPRIGDYVESEGGHRRAKICAVTHSVYVSSTGQKYPLVGIELTH